jgi:hypothetical protein
LHCTAHHVHSKGKAHQQQKRAQQSARGPSSTSERAGR